MGLAGCNNLLPNDVAVFVQILFEAKEGDFGENVRRCG